MSKIWSHDPGQQQFEKADFASLLAKGCFFKLILGGTPISPRQELLCSESLRSRRVWGLAAINNRIR